MFLYKSGAFKTRFPQKDHHICLLKMTLLFFRKGLELFGVMKGKDSKGVAWEKRKDTQRAGCSV